MKTTFQSFLIVVFSFVFFQNSIIAQPKFSNTESLSYVGEWVFGESTAISIIDSLAYLGVGKELRIYNLSNSSNLTLISTIGLPDKIHEIEFNKDNSVAFISISLFGIVIVDISDIKSLKIIKKIFFTTTDNQSISYDNNLLFVNSNRTGLFIYDVSDITNIREVTRKDRSFNIDPGSCDILVKNSIMYLTSLYEEDGYKTKLRIFDISNLPEITELSSYNFYNGYYRNIDYELRDMYLFISIYNKGIVTLDISDINNPKEIGVYEAIGITHIFMNDNLISATSIEGFQIVDSSYPDSLKRIASYGTSWPYANVATSTFLTENYVYMVDGSLTVFDFSEIDSLVKIQNLESRGMASRIEVNKNYAFVVDRNNGLLIFDISKIETPILISTFYAKNPVSIKVANDIAFLGTAETLYLIDIKNPSNPLVIAKCETSPIWDIEVKGNLVFLAEDDKMEIVDISNISLPKRVGVFGSSSFTDIEIVENIAFLGSSESSGIRVVDISQPEEPNLIRTLFNSSEFKSIIADEKYLFAQSSNLQIFDISNPSEPLLVSTNQLSSNVSNLALYNNYLYVSDYYEGVLLYDISNPIDISLKETYGVATYGITANENYVFVAGGNEGIHILRNNLISKVEENNLKLNYVLSQNYPNPFNPSTKIEYSIPVGTFHGMSLQKVTLKVYDILGKEVATLVNKEQSVGSYEIEFRANKLSSGVYFYALQTGNFVETKKMLLLR